MYRSRRCPPLPRRIDPTTGCNTVPAKQTREHDLYEVSTSSSSYIASLLIAGVHPNMKALKENAHNARTSSTTPRSAGECSNPKTIPSPREPILGKERGSHTSLREGAMHNPLRKERRLRYSDVNLCRRSLQMGKGSGVISARNSPRATPRRLQLSSISQGEANSVQDNINLDVRHPTVPLQITIHVWSLQNINVL